MYVCVYIHIYPFNADCSYSLVCGYIFYMYMCVCVCAYTSIYLCMYLYSCLMPTPILHSYVCHDSFIRVTHPFPSAYVFCI